MSNQQRFNGEWETKKLGEISDINPQNFSSNTNPNHKFNYITLEQVDSGKLLGYSEEVFETAPSRAQRILKNGDVLMSTVRPNLMAHLFYKEQVQNAVCSTGFAVLRAKQDISDPYFIFLQLFSDGVNDQIDKILSGSNYPAINSRDVNLIEIPFPPQIEEQHAIVEVLSDVDGLIKALEALIAKKRAIKQATMQQLLTGRTRLPGFSGDWETKQLGEIASFFKGSSLFTKTDMSLEGKRRCIHYGELFTTYGEYISEVLHGTDRDEAFFLSVSNDVLMPASDVTPNGLATASCISESDIILGGDILVIRVPAEILNGVFLAYAIKIHRNQVMQLVTGTTVYHLYGRDMANFKFDLPSIQEQNTIIEVLSDMDAEITALEQRRDKTIAIKQGMMQQLLTGKVRLLKSE